jgi:hypothetical protein
MPNPIRRMKAFLKKASEVEFEETPDYEALKRLISELTSPYLSDDKAASPASDSNPNEESKTKSFYKK